MNTNTTNDMSFDLDTYVISLQKPRALLNNLKRSGFDAKWFLGTNGKLINPRKLCKEFTPFWSTFGPKSAQGIALSHLNLWKTWLSTSESKHLLVVEDDVVLAKDAASKLQEALQHTPNDFDILYLGCFGCQSDTPTFTTLMSLFGTGLKSGCPQKINQHVTKPSVALATHAYVVSKSGAQKMIENLQGNIFQHIDYCLQSLSCKGVLNTYVITPRIAFQTSTNNKVSSNVTNSHPSLFNEWLSQYEIDTMVRANYLTTLSICRIGHFNVTISTIVMLIVGIVFYILGVDPLTATMWFLIISLPDLFSSSTPLFHYGFFIIPYLFGNSPSNFVGI